jgi:cardiolipin synthase
MRPVEFIADNEVSLLHCGTEYFPALIEAIDQAQYEIYFETYIFADDDTGKLVKAALKLAASRGVQVHMLTDWFGTGHKSANRMHEELQAAGVEHRIFNPWFTRGITRTHRKICVVDREIAFVGGININDDLYSDIGPRIQLAAPRWDFAVSVRGPLVACIHREAQAQWQRQGHIGLIKRYQLFKEMRKVAKAASDATVHAGFVVRDNLRNRSKIQKAYLHALGRARKSVLIANPYFAPGRKFRRGLAKAAQRGVEVVLLIGVGEIWLQDKVAVIDDDWATVGSSNVDGLSLFLNQEANVVIKDARFAQALRARIEAAVAEGVEIHVQDFEHVGRFRRIGYEIAFVAYKTLMRIFAVGKYA